MTDTQPAELLPWITPRLELLGTMDDVQNDASGDVDVEAFPEDMAS